MQLVLRMSSPEQTLAQLRTLVSLYDAGQVDLDYTISELQVILEKLCDTPASDASSSADGNSSS